MKIAEISAHRALAGSVNIRQFDPLKALLDQSACTSPRRHPVFMGWLDVEAAISIDQINKQKKQI